MYKNLEVRRKYINAWKRKKYAEDSEWRERKNRYKKDTIEWFREYKESLKCELCGEDRAPCLDFHHVIEKRKEISQMVASGWSVATILDEIEKCMVVCSNCHRMIHA